MVIEIGDTVQLKANTVFAGLKVIEIENGQALCSYLVLDKDLHGDERPTGYVTQEDHFQLDELTIVRKGG